MEGIWANIYRLGRRKTTLVDILQRVPLFSTLSGKELRVLERTVHPRVYEPEEIVFAETEPGAVMYVIRTGRVRVVLRHKSETPIQLTDLEAGDFFGEMALLGDAARSATAIAQERSEIIGFSHSDLIDIIALYPAMGAKISFCLAKTLSDRLRYTNTQLEEASDGGAH